MPTSSEMCVEASRRLSIETLAHGEKKTKSDREGTNISSYNHGRNKKRRQFIDINEIELDDGTIWYLQILVFSYLCRHHISQIAQVFQLRFAAPCGGVAQAPEEDRIQNREGASPANYKCYRQVSSLERIVVYTNPSFIYTELHTCF